MAVRRCCAKFSPILDRIEFWFHPPFQITFDHCAAAAIVDPSGLQRFENSKNAIGWKCSQRRLDQLAFFVSLFRIVGSSALEQVENDFGLIEVIDPGRQRSSVDSPIVGHHIPMKELDRYRLLKPISVEFVLAGCGETGVDEHDEIFAVTSLAQSLVEVGQRFIGPLNIESRTR